jgi:hypothetical protein
LVRGLKEMILFHKTGYETGVPNTLLGFGNYSLDSVEWKELKVKEPEFL